mmetsp:Transcript_126748/g.370433  ORF Transcript_126748/g.370433 Transcript_126748/m.370433 type:complete len:627 (-) Transcript_126748:239-2119(-)
MVGALLSGTHDTDPSAGMLDGIAVECNNLRVKRPLEEPCVASKRLKLHEMTAEELLVECKRLHELLHKAEVTIKEQREELDWKWKHLRVSTPLTPVAQTILHPEQQGWAWKWFAASCPCCKRPVDVTFLRVPPEEASDHQNAAGGNGIGPGSTRCDSPSSIEAVQELPPHPRIHGGSELPTALPQSAEAFAYVVVLWGASPGYILGALVLGKRLRDLGTKADLVLMHTDELPRNHLDILGGIWKLRQVDYVDGVVGLYSSRGTTFDGVFTKLNAWRCTEYSKVMLLDIDMVPLQSMDALFSLQTPAAMVRGNNDHAQEHGSRINGRAFFSGPDDPDWAWRQAGGINAGVILLSPSEATFAQMLSEVTSEIHPEHVPGNGPEQDYLSRFFAAAPWYHIGIEYNFQIHHIPFALENTLNRCNYAASQPDSPVEQRRWLAPRMRIPLDEIRNVHFSGDLKFWDYALSEDVEGMSHGQVAEDFLRRSLEGYKRWFELAEPDAVYKDFGCRRREGGLELIADSSDAGPLVALGVERTRQVTQRAVAAWRECLSRLMAENPRLLDELRVPSLPPGCPWKIGELLEADCSGTWLPCRVCGVHADGSCAVRYEQRYSWGDKERNVTQERLRSRA